MKQATVIRDQLLDERIGKDNWAPMLHVHDEYQVECAPDKVETVKATMVEAMEQAGRELPALGAVAIGGNCGLGPAELLPAMVAMRAAAPGAVLVAKPNAGLPVLEGDRAVYRGSPEEMADYARRLTAAGVRIVGGCCGSAPEHLRAMAEALGGAPR